MPDAAAAAAREVPSSTSAIAKVRRTARASFIRAALVRSSAADRSVRVIATAAMANSVNRNRHISNRRSRPRGIPPPTSQSQGPLVLLRRRRLQHAPAHLVEFDALEQRAEIALAEALVALALDQLEEDRADDGAGEDLQQPPAFRGRGAVHQDAVATEAVDVLAGVGQALGQQFVVGVGRVHELDAGGAHSFHARVDVVRAEGDVLDALALVGAEVFLDLALVVRAFVDGDADLAAGRGEGAAAEAGELAFDGEVADLAAIEEALIEAPPRVHAAALDVVRQVVDDREAIAPWRAVGAVEPGEVLVVDRAARTVPVHEVEQAAADALDRRDIELA